MTGFRWLEHPDILKNEAFTDLVISCEIESVFDNI